MTLLACPLPRVAPATGSIEACIDLGAIGRNVATIAAAGGGTVMAVVKADGFGHGGIPVARAALAAGAQSLGVATIPEALSLRAGGITAPILAWLFDPTAPLQQAIAEGIDLAISSPAHLEAVARAASAPVPAQLPGTLPVHRPASLPGPLPAFPPRARVQLQLDTGLHRGGCDRSQWPALLTATRAASDAGIVRLTGIWSHLIHPADPGHPDAARQLARLQQGVREAREAGLGPGTVHLANSAAALAAPELRLGQVRTGIGIYGVEPCTGRDFGLEPAMRVTARVAAVHDVQAGDGIGYDHTVIAPHDMRLALIPAGYADGIPALAPGRARILADGAPCLVTGRVAMDQLTVDVTGLDVRPGDDVTLLGPGPGEPSAADWATWCGIVPHEILTGLGNGPRVTRTYRRT